MLTMKERAYQVSNTVTINAYEVHYRFWHNHSNPGINEYGHIPISTQKRAAIIQDLNLNIPVSTIVATHNKAGKIQKQAAKVKGERPTRDMKINYDFVYSINYKQNCNLAIKHKDRAESARLWMQELKDEGCFTYFDSSGNERYYGFSTPFQLEQLTKYGNALCFDGTHKVCR